MAIVNALQLEPPDATPVPSCLYYDATRSVKSLGWGTFTKQFSGVCGPNFTKVGADMDIEQSLLRRKFVSAFWYFAAFSKGDGWKFDDVENGAKFRTLWPTVKLGKGWAKSLDQLMKLYLWPNLRHTFDGIHCVAAESGILIRKERKESSAAFTKAFRHTCWVA